MRGERYKCGEGRKGSLSEAMMGAIASSNRPEKNGKKQMEEAEAAKKAAAKKEEDQATNMFDANSFVDVRHGEIIRHSITKSRRIDVKDRMYTRPSMTEEEIEAFKWKWRKNVIKKKGVGKVGEIFGWRESTREFYLELCGLFRPVPPYKLDSNAHCEAPGFGRTHSAPTTLPSAITCKPPRHPTVTCSSSRTRTSPRTQLKASSPPNTEGRIELPIYAKKNTRVISTTNNVSNAPSCSGSSHIEQGMGEISQHRRDVRSLTVKNELFRPNSLEQAAC